MFRNTQQDKRPPQSTMLKHMSGVTKDSDSVFSAQLSQVMLIKRKTGLREKYSLPSLHIRAHLGR